MDITSGTQSGQVEAPEIDVEVNYHSHVSEFDEATVLMYQPLLNLIFNENSISTSSL
jgi:hypothetical protein